MKKKLLVLSVSAAALLLAACTGHRRDETPKPDGDTVEVEIKGEEKAREPGMPEIIEVPDSVDLLN